MSHSDIRSQKGRSEAAADGDAFSTEQVLAAYPDLAQINDSVWLNAVERATHHHFRAGTVLMRGTSPLNELLLIADGSIRVYYPAQDGREITLYRLNRGDLCVLSLGSMFHNRFFDIIAKSSTDVHALGISAQSFSTVLAGSDGFRNHMLATLNQRLCDLMCLVQDTAFQNLNVRLACLLGRLFERAKRDTIQITHQELAQELGTTREVVSRILKDFEQRKYVRLARGQITLNCYASLTGLRKET